MRVVRLVVGKAAGMVRARGTEAIARGIERRIWVSRFAGSIAAGLRPG